MAGPDVKPVAGSAGGRHAFSIDVEGFGEAMAESFPVPPALLEDAASADEVRRNVEQTLDALAELGIRGTFFYLGRIAEQLPSLVRRTAGEGHEIASHSHRHLRLNRMTTPEVRDALVRSKAALEDAGGVPVRGFRAPDFSITPDTLHIVDLVAEAGYAYDSSLYPVAGHDVYGVPGVERWPHRLENGLVEFPPTTTRALGRQLPALGGGWFRLYPLWVTRRILRATERAGRPGMFYIHPYELGTECPEVDGIGPYRRFRHTVNRTKGLERFRALAGEFRFTRVDALLEASGLLPAGAGAAA
jgi:polysaccharide deacetylase family protein (PEP-CTERM system associated)